MKHIYLLLFLSIFSCKETIKTEATISNNKTNDVISKVTDDSIILSDKAITLELKQKRLIEKSDHRNQLQQLIIQEKYFKLTPSYIVDFKYPLLNENINPVYANFNEYIKENYVDILGTEADILKSKEALCDTIKNNRFKETRYIDYKVYHVNHQLISILFYKENFYSGTLHPNYSFDCMNFNLNKGVFMNYEDFFKKGSEDEFAEILNKEITNQIMNGDMYYDCWEISNDAFFDYKNNFVINDTFVEYYFDDCVMCPAYTGSYSIKIPIVKLLSIVKTHNANLLVI